MTDQYYQDATESDTPDEDGDYEPFWENTRENYSYPDGQIIVSANDTGCIKVWRMDCGVYNLKPSADQAENNQRSFHFHRKSSSLDQITPHVNPTSSKSADSSKNRRNNLTGLFLTSNRSRP